MIMASTAENGVSAYRFTTNGVLAVSTRHLDQTASDASASPELVLVCFDDLALQFEGLFWKQLEVSDVVCRMLLWIVVPEFS